MKKTVIVFVKDGKYVADWQYSQGYFDVVHTEDLTKAEDHSSKDWQQQFKTFFEKKGYVVEKWEITAKKVES